MKRNSKILAGTAAAIIIGGAALTFLNQNSPLETVAYVNLQKYMGKWYEIAAFPQRFEKGCHCTTAEYSMHPDGYVEILNSCRKNSATGKLEIARGKAFVADSKTNAKLKVQFFWPFKGDYWILDLAPDYSYAVVGAPNRKYLWILARQPKMNTVLYQEITTSIKNKGFDISQLKMADQSCF